VNTDEKLLITIIKISELYKKTSSSMLRNYGLTFCQHTVLRILDGSPNGRSTITNTSKMMLVTGPNLSGVARRLAKIGLIARKNDPNDERITLLEISPRGRELLRNISVEIDKLVKNYLQDYSPDQIFKMLMQLRKCL